MALLAKGEPTRAELARELAIAPSVVRRWHHLGTNGGTAALGASEEGVPASELRAAQPRIKELERGLGKKTMEIENLQAARDEVKKDRASAACPSDDGTEAGPDPSHLGDQPARAYRESRADQRAMRGRTIRG